MKQFIVKLQVSASSYQVVTIDAVNIKAAIQKAIDQTGGMVTAWATKKEYDEKKVVFYSYDL